MAWHGSALGFWASFWVYFTIPPLKQILERKIVLARKQNTLHAVTAEGFIGIIYFHCDPQHYQYIKTVCEHVSEESRIPLHITSLTVPTTENLPKLKWGNEVLVMNHQSDGTREDFKINCLIILVDMHVKYFIFFILIRFTLFLLILCISSIFSE